MTASLELIEVLGVSPDAAVVDIGGGASLLRDFLLEGSAGGMKSPVNASMYSPGFPRRSLRKKRFEVLRDRELGIHAGGVAAGEVADQLVDLSCG